MKLGLPSSVKMANKNLTLTQVSDVARMISYTIDMEGENLSATDLYELSGDLEQSLAALLAVAQRKERESA